MKAALVLHGDAPDESDLARLASCDVVIAADGGAKALMGTDRQPDAIVGDLDSLEPEVFKWADAQGIPMERHPARKDFTDGELALERVLVEKPDNVIILGAHGGRTAHFVQNLRLLDRCRDAGVDAVLVGRGETVRLLQEGDTARLTAAKGDVLDLLALDGPAVVSLKGTAYDVSKAVIDPREARGVSNSIIADGARVTVHEGKVLVIVESEG